MYKIGEIAKLLGVSVDTLRLYDKKGIVSPMRMDNGYRYYTRNQMIILNYVMMLRKANLSLEVIKKFVHETNLDNSICELKDIQAYIDEQIDRLNSLKNVVDDYINIYDKCKNENYDIEILNDCKIVYLKIDDIKKFSNPCDFSDKNNRYRFVFSFYEKMQKFLSTSMGKKDGKIINDMKYAYTYVLKNDEDEKIFEETAYNIYPINKFAHCIIKCVIPTDYSAFEEKYRQICLAGHKIIGEILFRPASIRNGENANIDYYEVYFPIK